MRNLTAHLFDWPFAAAGLTLAVGLGLAGALPLAVQAQSTSPLVQTVTTVEVASETPEEALYRNLRMDDMVDVLIKEGFEYGDTLHTDMIPEMDADKWHAEVARIYDRPTVVAQLQANLKEALRGQDLTALNEFFSTPEGQEIVTLEVEARKVLSDPDLLQSAADNYEMVRRNNAELISQIDAIIEAGDLVEMNVVGSLNSNLMFYRGLIEGGALDWTDAELKSEVWAQEAVVRQEAKDWVRGFSLVAYRPVPNQALADYVALWQSDEGKVLNTALFEAYNKLYADVSRELGVAIAHYLASQPL